MAIPAGLEPATYSLEIVGLTDETPADRHAAKAVLDTLLIDLTSDDLKDLRAHTATLGERHLRLFLQTSLNAMADDLKQHAREIEMMPDWEARQDKTPESAPEPSSPPNRPRRRDRER